MDRGAEGRLSLNRLAPALGHDRVALGDPAGFEPVRRDLLGLAPLAPIAGSCARILR